MCLSLLMEFVITPAFSDNSNSSGRRMLIVFSLEDWSCFPCSSYGRWFLDWVLQISYIMLYTFSVLKESNPEYSLEELMPKLQYFGHLMERNSSEETLQFGKDWRQEEKGMTEDEMVGWHHWLNGHEFEQTLGDSEGQGSLGCCSLWGCKESDTTEWLNNNKFQALLSFPEKSWIILFYEAINVGNFRSLIVPSMSSISNLGPVFCFLFIFFEVQWRYSRIRCTVWWFNIYIHCIMITIRSLVNVYHQVHYENCFLVMRTFKNQSLSYFQICCWFSHEVMSDSLWSHGLQHPRLSYSSLSPGVC